MAIHPQRKQFTVEEYYQMGEAGILTEDDRVELIEGEIIQMAPIGISHSSLVDYLTNTIARMARKKGIVRTQNPIRLSDISEPQPDIALLKYRDDFYRKNHPTSEDVYLIIEVADTSLQYDRDTKVPLYARHDIPEVWIVDIQGQAIEVYRNPKEGQYLEISRLSPEQKIAPMHFPELVLSVKEILGL